jgi:hypothetical protein
MIIAKFSATSATAGETPENFCHNEKKPFSFQLYLAHSRGRRLAGISNQYSVGKVLQKPGEVVCKKHLGGPSLRFPQITPPPPNANLSAGD